MTNPNKLPDFSDDILRTEPLERSETIPSTWYTAPEILNLENECIFSECWQYAGHLAQVKNPGDYFLTTVADNPVVVVRDKDHVLRAFYNVCRHRGGPLATEDGNCKVFQCQYHGWTYLLDGSLRGVPDFDRVELFDKKDYGLTSISVDVWEGLIFVNLSNSPPKLHSFFDGIPERIAPIRLSEKKFYKRVEYRVQCNWKVYVDNYLEGYHLPFVHPELCKMLDYSQYVTEVFPHYSLQFSPFTDQNNVYQNNGGQAFYYCVFPNFMLNILPGRLQTNTIIPITHNSTCVVFDYFYDDISSQKALQIAEEDLRYSDLIQAEDIEICEHVQKGLASKAYHRGRFSVKRELGVYHFQSLLKETFRKFLQ
ncbi:aromatic ring-hydroxylating dioxygenase subunit alpha [bacterium]|nr:MAG: aromatic ring-hydroxylating dioxygenase subunit alpha [bacterium]